VGTVLTTGTFIQTGAIINAFGGSSPAGTYIVNQQYSTGTSVANSAATVGIGSKALTDKIVNGVTIPKVTNTGKGKKP
jgi:hypothetical protein